MACTPKATSFAGSGKNAEHPALKVACRPRCLSMPRHRAPRKACIAGPSTCHYTPCRIVPSLRCSHVRQEAVTTLIPKVWACPPLHCSGTGLLPGLADISSCSIGRAWGPFPERRLPERIQFIIKAPDVYNPQKTHAKQQLLAPSRLATDNATVPARMSQRILRNHFMTLNVRRPHVATRCSQV